MIWRIGMIYRILSLSIGFFYFLVFPILKKTSLNLSAIESILCIMPILYIMLKLLRKKDCCLPAVILEINLCAYLVGIGRLCVTSQKNSWQSHDFLRRFYQTPRIVELTMKYKDYTPL
jgi:hypothetical protein